MPVTVVTWNLQGNDGVDAHGVASVLDGAGLEIARFRYGTAEFARA